MKTKALFRMSQAGRADRFNTDCCEFRDLLINQPPAEKPQGVWPVLLLITLVLLVGFLAIGAAHFLI